ncbi:MAG: PTS sugar transporter subunit IIA [Pseudomonadota bacterium]
MIGLVLVSHGRLADEFRSALEHVVGPQRQLIAIGMGVDDDIESVRASLLSAAKKVESGSGVIIVTDMFGGTPSNVAISIMNDGPFEVIAGMNLPMLVKLAKLRSEKNMAELVDAAQEAGRKYIRVASQVLVGK